MNILNSSINMRTHPFRSLIRLLWLLVITAGLLDCGNSKAPRPGTALDPPAPATVSADSSDLRDGVMVYYLHLTSRCEDCLRIEQWTGNTLRTEFAPQMVADSLRWRPLDVDQPANLIFAENYQMTRSSVILALFRDGRRQEWIELPDVWQRLEDSTEFSEYISDEVSGMLNRYLSD